MSDSQISERRLSIRLPHELAADLRRVARLELNTASAVARRLIAAGLAQRAERLTPPPTAPDDAV